MLKKLSAVIITLLIILFPAAGCGQKTSDPTSPGNQAPIDLKVTIPNAPGSDAANLIEDMKKDLETKSGGRLKVTVYGGETLAKGPDMLSAVINGLADIVWTTATMNPGQLPLSQVSTLPMLGIANAVNAGKAMDELFATNQEFAKEWNNVYLFGLQPSAKAVIGTNNKQVKTLADLKGMRIRVAPGPQTEFMKLAGAQPMNVPITETWEAMDKKTMDGYVFGFTAVYDYKLFDVTKYWTVVNIYSPTLYIAMNKSKFDGLPDDLKQIVKTVLSETSVNICKFFDKIKQDSIDKLNAEFKDTTYIIPADEASKWQLLAEKSWQTWYDAMAKNNLDAKAVTEAALKLLDKHNAR